MTQKLLYLSRAAVLLCPFRLSHIFLLYPVSFVKCCLFVLSPFYLFNFLLIISHFFCFQNIFASLLSPFNAFELCKIASLNIQKHAICFLQFLSSWASLYRMQSIIYWWLVQMSYFYIYTHNQQLVVTLIGHLQWLWLRQSMGTLWRMIFLNFRLSP